MTQSEEARRYVLESVNAGDLRAEQAAEVLGVSERHVWRLLAAYRSRGAPALAHGNRGRRPHNALPPALAEAGVRFAAERYPGANHTHLSELLWEHEGLDLSRFTVRRILQQAGMPSPRRRRPPEHRVRRARMPREGMLLQVDGSHHAWLDERGPRFTLLLAVDDATGDVPYALFRPAEDARGYFSLMRQIVQRRGLPLALYSDRHGVFLAPAERRAQRPATQFARAMQELGITQVFARSPQAKGRVERLVGTFQDRLVTELRHLAAETIVEAQAVLERFLPSFNTRFRVQAAQPESAYRPLDPALDLDAVLAFRHARTVARDNTVKYRWRTLQLLPGPERTSFAGARVDVVERPDGDLSVRYHGEPIGTRLSPPPAGRLRTARAELARHPDHERIATGRGSGGALPGTPVNGTTNGTASHRAVNGGPLRPPTARQLARWKAIQQAQLQGLSMRATACLLGLSRVTVSNNVGANGVPGRRNGPAPALPNQSTLTESLISWTDTIAALRQSKHSASASWSPRAAWTRTGRSGAVRNDAGWCFVDWKPARPTRLACASRMGMASDPTRWSRSRSTKPLQRSWTVPPSARLRDQTCGRDAAGELRCLRAGRATLCGLYSSPARLEADRFAGSMSYAAARGFFRPVSVDADQRTTYTGGCLVLTPQRSSELGSRHRARGVI